MNIDEIRKNAPIGATHYILIGNKIIYCKMVGILLYCHDDNLDTYIRLYGDHVLKPL